MVAEKTFLEKSWRSAVLLSLAAVLSFALTSATFGILLPWLINGEAPLRPANDQPVTAGMALGTMLIFAFLLAVLSGIGAIWLYRFFGPRYYGKKGLVMWVAFGVILAILLKAPEWVLGDNLTWLQQMWRFVSAFPAFFAARWVSRV